MPRAILILPDQLFQYHPALLTNSGAMVFFLEDPLFFGDRQYPIAFHKQKLILHRASLKNYAHTLAKRGFSTYYIDCEKLQKGAESYLNIFKNQGISQIEMADPVNDLAEKRILQAAESCGATVHFLETPSFLSSKKWIIDYLFPLEHYAFTPFYIQQRKRLGVLLTDQGKPLGGKWSFDSENRKKAPRHLTYPPLPPTATTSFVQEALNYVEKHFSHRYGSATPFAYPTTHAEARAWLIHFLETKLSFFGPYQDAIVKNEFSLMHSVLTPALNIGLLTPQEILTSTLQYCECHSIALNSVEGFIRQVIGWREFIMGVYQVSHVRQRKGNFWGHTRKIPPSFYTGTTGIEPIDQTIQKLLKSGYCHHIERLMVLGSFMLLCEFDPHEVYRWFMEMFIDAYDWVMVPNVFGMSQYADGGLMATKPYICGSNYIKKMSDYKEGEWSRIWDALFWRFIHKHYTFFASQTRLNMLVQKLNGMEKGKLEDYLKLGEHFLHTLNYS